MSSDGQSNQDTAVVSNWISFYVPSLRSRPFVHPLCTQCDIHSFYELRTELTKSPLWSVCMIECDSRIQSS